MTNPSEPNRYAKIIGAIFDSKFSPGKTEFDFVRDEIITAAKQLKIDLPRNLGDVIYSFRYRVELPSRITALAPPGMEWVIRPVGQSKYRFCLAEAARITPNSLLAETKIPDATPGIIRRYSLSDEQALLAQVRYCRLLDIFTGVACHSLQNHLRTSVPQMGQVETDELYVGIDKRGVHYLFPVQAKGGADRLGIVQIEQDFAMCKHKFPNLVAIPVAVQFMGKNLIAMFSFELNKSKVKVASERHYRLVAPQELSDSDLAAYLLRRDD